MHDRFKYVCRLLTLSFLTVGLSACNQRETDKAAWEFCTIGEEGWCTEDTLAFDIDSIKTDGYYETMLCLRTSAGNACPYTDISLLVSCHWQTGSALVSRSDTLKCVFTTDNGDVRGTGVSLYQYNLPMDTLYLPAHSRGRIVVGHIMRRSPLPGIHDVGIKVRKLSDQSLSGDSRSKAATRGCTISNRAVF